MLTDMRGRRKRHIYDQSAAQQLEHLRDPLDPSTQVPLWRDLLCLTKDGPVDRATFMRFAVNIFRQHSFYRADAA